jgi:hypothetical protein
MSARSSARNPAGINPVTSNAIHKPSGPDHERAIRKADNEADYKSGAPQRIQCRKSRDGSYVHGGVGPHVAEDGKVKVSHRAEPEQPQGEQRSFGDPHCQLLSAPSLRSPVHNGFLSQAARQMLGGDVGRQGNREVTALAGFIRYGMVEHARKPSAQAP